LAARYPDGNIVDGEYRPSRTAMEGVIDPRELHMRRLGLVTD
jgi:hypothetical protein